MESITHGPYQSNTGGRILNLLRVAVKGLVQRKTMTALALVGLILGVGTIVTLVSVTTGVQSLVSEKTGEAKGIMITEKDSALGPFYSLVDMSDIEKIEKMPGIRNVCPRVTHIAKSIDGKFITMGMGMQGIIIGVEPARESAKRIGPIVSKGNIIGGRFLLQTDRKSAVVGKNIADDYNKGVGSSLKIDGTKFKVVGVYETGTTQTDSYIIIPIGEARTLEGLDNSKIRSAFIELDNPHMASEMVSAIEARDSSLQAISTEEFGQMLGGLLENVGAFLWAISALAALVAGVNIINTMLMSIMERERELGIMRAIGWTREDIMVLIVAESLVIGIVGGVVGICVGVVAVALVRGILDIPMLVDVGLAVEAMLFAVAIGGLGGMYPAWRASLLNPLDVIKGE